MPPNQTPRPSNGGDLGRIAFVGAGMMAEAMIRGLIDRGVAHPSQIVAGDILADRRQLIADRHGVATTDDNRAAIVGADVVVLAVKPQQMTAALADLKGRLSTGQLVLSIAAGVTVGTLVAGLDHAEVVRAIPNTPARVGRGVSVWIPTPAVREEQQVRARLILGALGAEIAVADEKFLDMATALSGSGPAYVFLIIEAMADAGVSIGLPRDVADTLAIQTVLGAAEMARLTGEHPAALKDQVMSPAGTTAAGLFELEDGRLRAVLHRAVRAAYERSLELGKLG